MQKSITQSFKETQKTGESLARKILQQQPSKKAVVLGLSGDLGAGKTTFLQGFAMGFGIKEKILSPTFVILKKFQIPNPKLQINSKFKSFYHIDCYRVKSEKDLEILGLKEIIKNPENIVAIEWPERIKKIMPKKIISIKFDHRSENQRTLTIIR